MITFQSSVYGVLRLLLVFLLACPVEALARSRDGERPETLIVIPVGIETSELSDALVSDLRKRLSGRVRVLTTAQTEALLSGSGDDRKVPERLRAVRLIEDCLEDYYGFASDGPETVRRLENAVAYVRQSVPPSRETSQLMVSATIALSWLEYAGGDRVAAKQRLAELARISAVRDFPFGFYPEGFREFARMELSRGEALPTRSLTVTATPSDAAIYIDNIYAGTAPLTILLPAGDRTIGAAAAGYGAAVKTVSGGKGGGRVHLKLPRRSPRDDDRNWLLGNWPLAGTAEKTALIAQVGKRTGADKAVLLESAKKGFIAVLYDVRTAKKITEFVLPSEFGLQIANAVAPAADATAPVAESKKAGNAAGGQSRKAFYQKPVFWIAAGGLVLTGIAVGVFSGKSSSQEPSTGGLVVGF